nr:MAG TPA: hypothetical protein [Caudoviricetes sp.]
MLIYRICHTINIREKLLIDVQMFGRYNCSKKTNECS